MKVLVWAQRADRPRRPGLQSDPANGIDLVKVSGIPATWKLNNKQTSGDITVTGFTAETTTVTFIKFGVTIVSPSITSSTRIKAAPL